MVMPTKEYLESQKRCYHRAIEAASTYSMSAGWSAEKSMEADAKKFAAYHEHEENFGEDPVCEFHEVFGMLPVYPYKQEK